MSSETSTEPLQPWQFFTLAGLVGATIVVFMSRGASPASVIVLSLTIFAAAAVGVTALRTFVPLARPSEAEPPQVLGGRTRAALERDKALVLRAIKELEFDRSMGKVSEKDFAEMSGRLRARAGRLIRQLDAGNTYRADIEKEIEKRLGSSVPPRRATEPVPAAGQERACSSCSTPNDIDARFCKSCGSTLEQRA